MQPIVRNAGNAGPFTLDGTRTFLVGSRDVAVIDPGPEVERHLRALLVPLEGADRVTILVTHWHADHAGLASRLANELGGLAVHGPGPSADRPLEDGARIETDRGTLVCVATPGHARHHHAFHWPRARALFVGDLVLGEGDTTWVGEYPGCVREYLESLERVAAMDVDVLYPAHGPPVTDPGGVVARYRAHRLGRIAQVRKALLDDPRASTGDLLERVYGAVPPDLRRAAEQSVEALVEHLEEAPA